MKHPLRNPGIFLSPAFEAAIIMTELDRGVELPAIVVLPLLGLQMIDSRSGFVHFTFRQSAMPLTIFNTQTTNGRICDDRFVDSGLYAS